MNENCMRLIKIVFLNTKLTFYDSIKLVLLTYTHSNILLSTDLQAFKKLFFNLIQTIKKATLYIENYIECTK